ncbi:MAG: leucine-rich repeat protein [bacterium]
MYKIKCIKCLKENETKDEKYNCSCGNEINVLESKELCNVDESYLIRLQTVLNDTQRLKKYSMLHELALLFDLDDDYDQSLKYSKMAYELGDQDAGLYIGDAYYDGNGCKQNYEKAVEQFKVLMDAGNVLAKSNYAYCLENGKGLIKDQKKAYELYFEAAKENCWHALRQIACNYEFGYRDKVDLNEAIKWHKLAYENGSGASANDIGNFYYSGRGVAQDYKIAFEWHMKGALLGEPVALNQVGISYNLGKGVEQNYEKSFYWLKEAAYKKNDDAYFALGMYYDNGIGVKKDLNEAIKWYTKAADKGDMNAAKALSKLKLKGNSKVVNPVEILSGKHDVDRLPDVELNDIIARDSFLKVLEGSKDVKMVPRNFSSWGYGTYSYNSNVLIIEDGVDDMRRVIFKNIDTFVYLGSKGIKSIKAYTSMKVKRAIFINSGFLKGRNLLIEGCTYIIENFNDFNDKENFLKELKKKSDKMQDLLRDLIKLNNDKINNFIKENNIVIIEEKNITDEVETVDGTLFTNINFKEDIKEIAKKLSAEPYFKNINIDVEKTKITTSYRMYSPEPYTSRLSKIAQTLIIQSNVEFIGSLAYKDIENLIYLGEKGLPNFNLWKKYKGEIPNIIFLDTGFLSGKMFLVEGCTFIINNYEHFLDKNNFITTLKKKTDKIKSLVHDLVQTNNVNIIKFLINNGVLSYEFMLKASTSNLSQEVKVFLLNELKDIKEDVIKEYEEKEERKENLDLGFEQYTLKDFKEHFACTVKDDKIIISKYKGYSDVVTIPVVNGITKFEFKYIGKNYSIKKILFEEGVTSISRSYETKEYPFQDTNLLEEIHVPKSLTHIDSNFVETLRKNKVNIYSSNTDNPNNLMMVGNLLIQYNSIIYLNNRTTVKDIVIPDNVTSILDDAFLNCKSLVSVKLHDNVVNIGNNAFKNCELLVNIKLHDKVANIGDEAFRGCESLKTIQLPNSIESLGDALFGGCYLLEEVNIPEKITQLNDNMFAFCSSLKSIDISKITKIGNNTFESCRELVDINIPNTLTTIGSGVFKNCSAISNITLPSNITMIPDESFYGCSSLTNFTLNDTVTQIGKFAFFGCKSLSNIVIPNSVVKIDSYAFRSSNLESIIIPNTVKELLEGSLAQCLSLKTVVLPETINVLNASLFYECSNLESVNIPSGVTSLESSVFYSCASLKNLILPKKLQRIGSSAFSGCSSLNNITISDSVAEVGRDLFLNCSTMTDISLPDKITKIGYWTFSGCTSLKNVKLPKGVISIPAGSFKNCSSLTNITIPDVITSIGYATFEGCTSLKEIHIPKKLKVLENSMFSGCTSLEKIDLPKELEKVSYSVFEKCTSLKEITIPKTVTEIRESTFSGCDNLRTVYIDSGIYHIDSQAFRGTTNLTVVFKGEIPSKFEWIKKEGIKVLCN